MTSTEFVGARDLLRGPVASATGYRSTGQVPMLHRGLPSPYLTFIFSLEGPVVGGADPAEARGPLAFRHHIVLGGLHTRPAYVQQPERQAGIELAVHPLASRALFGVPAAELRALSTDGADVLGRPATRLHARLVECSDWDESFDLVAAYLRGRLDRARFAEVRPEIAEAWAWLARRGGNGSVRDLSRHVLLSERQLETLFAREVGVGPKAVGRLIRFHRAVGILADGVRSGHEPRVGHVASRVGYADQSHLVRDFRQFTGTSPTAWLAEERGNVQAGGHHHREDSHA